jgi:hypothetical protein
VCDLTIIARFVCRNGKDKNMFLSLNLALEIIAKEPKNK